MLLDCYQRSTFAARQAAICWSANLQPQIKSSFKMGSLIGRGSGESFQLAFHSPDFVVVQPSEGQSAVTSPRARRRGQSTRLLAFVQSSDDREIAVHSRRQAT